MVIQATHTRDWQWQAVLGQMEDLRRQNYIYRLKQDPASSTYWTITTSGLSYLQALESFAAPKTEVAPQPEPQPAEIPQQIQPPAPVVATGLSPVPTRKRRVGPFVERAAFRVRKLISWEEMPTHLAAHLLYDSAKALVYGGTVIYLVHLLHEIKSLLPQPPK
jgi:hypothetical protein